MKTAALLYGFTSVKEPEAQNQDLSPRDKPCREDRGLRRERGEEVQRTKRPDYTRIE